jgi:release factor glutamine methyltransferase
VPERVLELIQKAAPYLAGHGSTSPRLDAELLLAQVLDCTRMDLYLRFEREVAADHLAAFRELCRRRAAGEPMAYIRGGKEFMSLDFEVTPAVLVPRPETEVLTEAALARLSIAGPNDGGQRMLDVGTGSGVIAISILVASPELHAVGTDISAAALQVAGRNAQRHQVADRLELVETDLASGVEGPFDLVTANLPYIDPSWEDGVTKQVRATEPAEALFAGDGGLELVKRLLAELPRLVRPGGAALFEVDPRNAREALRQADEMGGAGLLQDRSGSDRVLAVELRR